MTLDELLALFPDSPPENISAAKIRTLITEIATHISELQNRVALLESQGSVIVLDGSWQYSDSAPPPTGSQVRFDNTDLALATQAHFRVMDNEGLDRTPLFNSPISVFRIQDANDSTNFAIFDVTGPAVIASGTATLPVTFQDGGGTIPNQKALVVFATEAP